ncbi:glycosyltransferase [Ruminococcus albus]|uniref:Uncharacterized protein n=1 Tax=Ruminococcus albus TaxID=1264 RepID=A0A1H7KQG3_RUMAL|nr:glycosyltransferase [Ruminococcus albus]SEK88978.1 hypothetical protein SAMN05216469_10758 [Ruminococcus albus]
MKILFVIDNLGGGGAQKLVSDLILAITNAHCELLLLSNKTDKYYSLLVQNGIKIHIIPKSYKSPISKMHYMWQIIKKGQYSIIHANLFPAFYYVSAIKFLHRKKCPPILMTEHSTDNGRRHKPLFFFIEVLIYSQYDHIISISNQTQIYLLSWLKNNRNNGKRYSVIENGIDVRRFANAGKYKREQIFPGILKEDFLISMVGSFTNQKNHKNMIEAISILPDEYKLLLVGEGKLYNDIVQLVNEKALNKRVMFLGFRKDTAEIMKSVDLVCVPSIWEGFGLVAVEAMACGVPVAVANVPGLSEVVGDAGIQFDPCNPKDIANALRKCRDSMAFDNENTNNRIARAQRFSILRMKNEYIALFFKYCNR